MRVRYLWWLILIGVSISVLAQPNACPQLVEDALLRADDNCSELDRNAACYGYDLVSASFVEEVPDEFFSVPSDRSPVADLRSLQTFPFDESAGQWGIALMNLQANLPDSLPGQAVTFVLLGDVEVENATAPEDLFDNADPVTVSTTLNAALRSAPSPFSNTRLLVPAGTAIAADGISEDGRWLRVVYDETPGWVLRDYTDSVDVLLDLPVLNGEQFTSMQAFYLRTTPAQTACEEVPDSSLVLQSPEGITVDLQVNGADIQVGSTIVLEILPPGDFMKVTVIDGHVKLFANQFMSSDIDLYTGQSSTICLSPPDDRGQDGLGNDRVISCAWSAPVDNLQTDLAARFCVLEQLSVDLIFYDIDLACGLSPFPVTEVVATEVPAATPDILETGVAGRATPEIIQTDEPAAEGAGNNWCFPGEPWGDGRCNDPDPSLFNWYWLCGWHLAQIDNGNQTIEETVKTCRPATPEPEVVADNNGFTASWSCVGTTVTVVWNNLPAGNSALTIDYFEDYSGGFSNVVVPFPAVNGSTSFPIVDNGAAREAHAGTATGSPSGFTNIAPADLQCT